MEVSAEVCSDGRDGVRPPETEVHLADDRVQQLDCANTAVKRRVT
jgi:hypothetical protein